jgi:hypothetical protein
VEAQRREAENTRRKNKKIEMEYQEVKSSVV